MNNNLLETLVGALVLVVAGLFLYFAYSRTDVAAGGEFELIAKFDRIDGIALGSDVRISGIKVGSVTNQFLDLDSFEATLQISIDSDIALPEDSSAKISSEGLLGGSFVALEPGGAPDLLRAGDEIQFTQGTVDLMGLIGQVVHGTVSNDKE